MKRLIKLCAILLLLSGAGFAAYRMYDMASEYKAGNDIYEQVQQSAIQAAPTEKASAAKDATKVLSPVAKGAPIDSGTDFPVINFQLLEAQNSDTVGWVCIEGTNINYPVVQGEDNRHYVSTLFDGSENQAGSIFMDYRNNADMDNIHTILYGHNMLDKSMFADILNYQNQEYYDTHPYGIYITREQNYRFDIVAAYVASLADPAWQLEFAAQEELLQWLNEAVEKTEFVSDVTPQADDKFITLSTCSYEFDDARFVLVGVLHDCGPPEEDNNLN